MHTHRNRAATAPIRNTTPKTIPEMAVPLEHTHTVLPWLLCRWHGSVRWFMVCVQCTGACELALQSRKITPHTHRFQILLTPVTKSDSDSDFESSSKRTLCKQRWYIFMYFKNGFITKRNRNAQAAVLNRGRQGVKGQISWWGFQACLKTAGLSVYSFQSCCQTRSSTTTCSWKMFTSNWGKKTQQLLHRKMIYFNFSAHFLYKKSNSEKGRTSYSVISLHKGVRVNNNLFYFWM